MISEKEYTYDWGYAATLALFKKNPAITAVFCADDEIATGAIDALRFALKKKVPEDVVLIGFDDHPSPRARRISSPRCGNRLRK